MVEEPRHHVTTSFEAGRTRVPDGEQLEFATETGSVIYTANVADYAELHKEWMAAERDHAGIYQQLDVGEQIRRLDRVLQEYEGRDMTNVFVYL